MKLPDFSLILTCKCEQASLIASEGLDRPLTFSERLARWLHDLVCHNCRKVTRQLRWLCKVLGDMPDDVRARLAARLNRLSVKSRGRIVRQMRQQK